MNKCNRCIIPLTRLLGIILTCIGFGMLLVLVIPYWLCYVLAFALFIIGICLIFLSTLYTKHILLNIVI